MRRLLLRSPTFGRDLRKWLKSHPDTAGLALGGSPATLGITSYMNRLDISSKLVHLTRATEGISAEARFGQILSEGTLKGSDRGIRGGSTVICFTEAPVTMLAGVLANASAFNMRYAPLGVMVDKAWLYSLGGRPVIYQSNEEFDELPDSKKYLHVRFEPDRDHDYTWEREWRVKCNSIQLDPGKTTVIVPSREWEERYRSLRAARKSRSSYLLRGLSVPQPPSWHFVALEDLGIPFERMDPISFENVL